MGVWLSANLKLRTLGTIAADLNRSGTNRKGRLEGGSGGGGGTNPGLGTCRMAIRDRGATSPNMFIAPWGSLRPPPRPDDIAGGVASAAPGCAASAAGGCGWDASAGWLDSGTAEGCCGYSPPGGGCAVPGAAVAGAYIGAAGVAVMPGGHECPGGTKTVILESGWPQRPQVAARRPFHGQSIASAEFTAP